MNQFRLAVVVLCVASLFCLRGALAAADDAKEKPKDAATFDDRTATLTETTDGKEKETKLELKYCLKVKGYFDKDGFNMEEVDSEGPGAKLTDANGNQAGAMEKGDIIREVDGKEVKSAKDYVKAINDAADKAKIKLKVRDVNTGKDMELYVAAEKRE